MMAAGKCPLCGVEKELIQSHIIPEGFYKHLYNGKHRAIHADKKTLDTQWIQKGISEYPKSRMISRLSNDHAFYWEGPGGLERHTDYQRI